MLINTPYKVIVMRKKIALTLSVILIISMNLSTAAIELNSSTTVLAEQSYSGSEADFNIVISQEVEASSISNLITGFMSKISESSASFEKNDFGIKGNITLGSRVENQNLLIKFTDVIDHQIQIQNDNSLLLFNGDGELVAAVGTLDITDANGNPVDVQANLFDNMVQYDIKDTSAAYPLSGGIVIYSNNSFSTWFSSGSWITRDGAISLSLKHTGWASLGVSTGMITWSWNTVKAKFSSSSNWYNETGMHEQYLCHVNFAANKSEWNLEPWRPAVGYAKTIAASCNP